MQIVDLDVKFMEYFHEQEGFGLRSERFYDAVNDGDNPNLDETMKAWLQAAFIQGARVMAQDTLDTLHDYGTAVSGINGVCLTGSQAFDSAASNLMLYYTQVLEDDK